MSDGSLYDQTASGLIEKLEMPVLFLIKFFFWMMVFKQVYLLFLLPQQCFHSMRSQHMNEWLKSVFACWIWIEGSILMLKKITHIIFKLIWDQHKRSKSTQIWNMALCVIWWPNLIFRTLNFWKNMLACECCM